MSEELYPFLITDTINNKTIKGPGKTDAHPNCPFYFQYILQ